MMYRVWGTKWDRLGHIKNVVHNADFEKIQKYYFLNRMKYIEGSLMKSSGIYNFQRTLKSVGSKKNGF